MAMLTLDISTSLDGFVAGPKQTLEEPLGGGRRTIARVGLRPRGIPRETWFVRRRDQCRQDGIEAALEQARDAAGGKDVAVGGGANVAQQYLKAGLLDEFQIHVVPVLLGGGVRLFEGHLASAPGDVECTRVVESPTVSRTSSTAW
jgi:riboflavin biosynthesis pyrimidine reductase